MIIKKRQSRGEGLKLFEGPRKLPPMRVPLRQSGDTSIPNKHSQCQVCACKGNQKKWGEGRAGIEGQENTD